MVRISPRYNGSRRSHLLLTSPYTTPVLVIILVLTLIWHHSSDCYNNLNLQQGLEGLASMQSSTIKTTVRKSPLQRESQQQQRPQGGGSSNKNEEVVLYDSSAACMELPRIQPGGVFFLNPLQVHQVATIAEVKPSFFFGTKLSPPNRIAYHMGDDIPYFELIQESLQVSQSLHSMQQPPREYVALDMGANQGFYTWYMASLGMQVHAFEIQPDNFDSLQHGRVFNPKEVADRAHLYPLGMAASIGWVGKSKHDSYHGHIEKSDNGNILSITMDCWAQHVQPQPLPIQFVKLDVEGFEIAVLQGAHQSLLKQKGDVVTWFMEVAPDRWSRANVSLEVGIGEMKRLQTDLFDRSYLMVRGDKECPYSVATDHLKDTEPRLLSRKNKMYALSSPAELETILTTMNQKHYSCNFWFSNQETSLKL